MPAADLDALKEYYTRLLFDQFGFIEAKVDGKTHEDVYQRFTKLWLRLARVPEGQSGSDDLEKWRSYLVNELTDRVSFTGDHVPGNSFLEVWRSYQAIYGNLAT